MLFANLEAITRGEELRELYSTILHSNQVFKKISAKETNIFLIISHYYYIMLLKPLW